MQVVLLGEKEIKLEQSEPVKKACQCYLKMYRSTLSVTCWPWSMPPAVIH
jgi:hypothetical protein